MNNHVRLQKNDSVHVECTEHKTLLEFEIFYGDSIYLQVAPCPKCIEEAKEKGRKEVERAPWKRMFEFVKAQQLG